LRVWREREGNILKGEKYEEKWKNVSKILAGSSAPTNNKIKL